MFQVGHPDPAPLAPLPLTTHRRCPGPVAHLGAGIHARPACTPGPTFGGKVTGIHRRPSGGIRDPEMSRMCRGPPVVSKNAGIHTRTPGRRGPTVVDRGPRDDLPPTGPRGAGGTVHSCCQRLYQGLNIHPFSGRASEKHRVLRGSASSFGTRKPHEVGKACFQGLSPQRHPSMDPDQHPGIRMDPDQHPGIRVTQGRRDFWWLTPFKFYFLF
jgi:hypothetical protein